MADDVHPPPSDAGDEPGFEFVDAAHHHRYELRRGSEVVSFANYRVEGDVLVIPYVETDPRHRGHGFSNVLLEGVVAAARRDGRRIRPTCGYAASVLRARPDAGEILEAR